MADGGSPLGYLDVDRSLSGRRWRARPADAELTRRHQMMLGLDEPMARALAARGVTAEAAESYLTPTLKALFPDPSSFADMDKAAGVLVDALVADRPVDRKSTRLNSSHVVISYAVFCLKQKNLQ